MTRDEFKRQIRLRPSYTRPAAGTATANRQPRPPGQDHTLEWMRTAQYRKTHPCYHIDFTQWKKKASCGCKCGTIYVCEKYGECAITHNRDCQVRSCVFCPSYIETIELPAASRPLTIPVGVTTCPVIRCARTNGKTTCDKRSCPCGGKVFDYRDTLPKTLQSIVVAGWDQSEVTIFAEPESATDPSVIEAIRSGWNVVWNEKRLGPWSNLYAGLRYQRAAHPKADCYLMMEDDTWLARNTKTEIQRRGLPRDSQWGIVRVFRMSGRGHPWRQADVFCESKRTDGYQRVRTGEHLWGTNAVLYSPLAVDRMLADRIDDSQEDSPDIKIGKLMVRYGFSEWCCNPSLAQTDTSKPSAVGHGQNKDMESSDFIEDALQVQEMYA